MHAPCFSFASLLTTFPRRQFDADEEIIRIVVTAIV